MRWLFFEITTSFSLLFLLSVSRNILSGGRSNHRANDIANVQAKPSLIFCFLQVQKKKKLFTAEPAWLGIHQVAPAPRRSARARAVWLNSGRRRRANKDAAGIGPPPSTGAARSPSVSPTGASFVSTPLLPPLKHPQAAARYKLD